MSQDISTTIASLTGYVKRQAKLHIHTLLAGACSIWSRGKRFHQLETDVFVIGVYSVDSKDGNLQLVIKCVFCFVH